MKKHFMAVFAALLFTGSQIVAQEKEVTLPEITISGSSKVSSEVGQAFKKAFPNSQNLRWYKMDQDYLAKFIKDDMEHNALFKKSGVLKYVISYGFAQDLPEATHKMIAADYPEFNITRAILVKQGARNIWMVHLEGSKNYVTVRIEDQELTEVQRFTKPS